KVAMRWNRGGPLRSSVEASVMLVERRGWVIAAEIGSTGDRMSLMSWRKAAAFKRWHEPDDARVSRPESVSGSEWNSPGRLGNSSGLLGSSRSAFRSRSGKIEFVQLRLKGIEIV